MEASGCIPEALGLSVYVWEIIGVMGIIRVAGILGIIGIIGFRGLGLRVEAVGFKV